MIPNNNDDLHADFEIDEQPTYTHRLNISGDRVIGYTDQIEAMKQAIYLILNIERYDYLIYSWNYGVELIDLIGQPIPFVLPEIERRIVEALLQDDRIEAVHSFEFERIEKDKIHTTFKVDTIFGTVNAEKVVDV
jgi:hypothetical protein